MTAGLADLQSMMQDRLLGGSDAIAFHLAQGGPFLKVYGNGYGARLHEVMADVFPGVHALIGDDGFARAVEDYTAAHPSRFRSIRWLGRDFPAWLTDAPAWRGQPVVTEMAAYEWALSLAFDAPDRDPLPIEALASVAPEAWAGLTFEFHPALQTLRLSHDVAPFRRAAAEDKDPEAVPPKLEAPGVWAVWRDSETLIVRYRPLAGDEAQGLEAVRGGGDFSALCEIAAETVPPEEVAARAAGFLKDWVDAGWITGLGGIPEAALPNDR